MKMNDEGKQTKKERTDGYGYCWTFYGYVNDECAVEGECSHAG